MREQIKGEVRIKGLWVSESEEGIKVRGSGYFWVIFKGYQVVDCEPRVRTKTSGAAFLRKASEIVSEICMARRKASTAS